jgi:hypothetical protein
MLHLVDKENMDRSAPQVNAADKLIEGSQGALGTLSSSFQTAITTAPKSRMIFRNNLLLWYDDQGRVSSVYGVIPSIALYPITITALYGYDVFVDILGLTDPT